MARPRLLWFSILSGVACGFNALGACGPAVKPQAPPPDGACDVRACGAVGDGQANDTAALQLAVDRVAAAGGGTVRLPPGRYMSGTLFLRSGVTFDVEGGATLLGSTKFSDYQDLSHAGSPLPPSPYTQDEARFRALLVALDAHDVAVTGGGTIDGRGGLLAGNIHRLQAEGRLPGNAAVRPDESLRPCLINFVRCRGVRVADVTLRDAACWVENYTACDGLTLDHVTVRSQAYWNNDGIDLSGCRHVRVAHCDIDSADDGICLKSNGSDCQDVEVHDCRVRSWANAIKLGTVSFGGFRRVAIRHVQVWGSGHAGLSIESVDGAVIDDLTVSDVAMTNLRQAILIKLGSRHAPGGRVGAIRNVTLTDVTADLADGDPDAGQPFRAPVPAYRHNRFPCIISGLPGHPIGGVTLRRVTCHTPGGGSGAVASVPLDRLGDIPEHADGYPEYSMHGELPAFGWFVRHAAGVTLDDVRVACRRADGRAGLVFDDVCGLNGSGLEVADPGGGGPAIVLSRVRGASIRGAVDPASVRVMDGCNGVSVGGPAAMPRQPEANEP